MKLVSLSVLIDVNVDHLRLLYLLLLFCFCLFDDHIVLHFLSEVSCDLKLIVIEFWIVYQIRQWVAPWSLYWFLSFLLNYVLFKLFTLFSFQLEMLWFLLNLLLFDDIYVIILHLLFDFLLQFFLLLFRHPCRVNIGKYWFLLLW